MSQSEKSAYYAALKESGVSFDKHYRDYTTVELKKMYAEKAPANAPEPVVQPREAPKPPPLQPRPAQPDESMPISSIPFSDKPVTTLAGTAYDENAEDTPLRRDSQGRIWYREEVRKPSHPLPRARRVVKYIDPGTRRVEHKAGNFVESFEIAGSERRSSEVKITLPSFQVGIYRDPRFPFRIHTYQDRIGFDLFDVQDFYGGADLVPNSIGRVYIGGDLCYDVRETIRTIQHEYRDQVLKGNNR